MRFVLTGAVRRGAPFRPPVGGWVGDVNRCCQQSESVAATAGRCSVLLVVLFLVLLVLSPWVLGLSPLILSLGGVSRRQTEPRIAINVPSKVTLAHTQTHDSPD